MNSKSPLGIWRIEHRDWLGFIELRADGTFRRMPHIDSGSWILDADGSALLKWNRWKPERARLVDGKMIGDRFEGERVELESSNATSAKTLKINLPGDPSFNNSVLFWNGRTLMTYRKRHGLRSAIFIAEVDDQFDPIVVNDRALINTAQDGRLCELNGSLYCSYSSISPGRCHMHICRLDDDLNVIFDKHFDPIKEGSDKNWMFFSMDGDIFCIYDYQPDLTVWRMNENLEVTGIIRKKPARWVFGEIRGSTPPILINGKLAMIIHSRIGEKAYINAILRMTKEFDVISIQELDLDDFNIVFPCGLMERRGRYFVSYGVDERSCRVRELLTT